MIRIGQHKSKYIYIILLFSLWIRIHDLGGFCLFWDELFGRDWNTGRSIGGTIVKILRDDVHPPLYYLMLRPFLSLPLSQEFALRLPSALLGVAGVYVTYLAACALFGLEAGVISALLLAINPMHMFHSQEARMYTLLYLVSVIFFWAWMKFDKTGKSRDFWLLVMASVLGFYSHYYFVFPFLFLAAAYLLTHRNLRSLSILAAWQAAVLVCILPVLVCARASPFHPGFSYQISLHAWWLKPANFMQFLDNFSIMLEGRHFQLTGYWGLIIMIILLLHGFRAGIGDIRRKYMLLAAYLFFPLLLLFGFSHLMSALFSAAVYEPSHAMFALPALILLLAVSLSRMPLKVRYLCLAVLLLIEWQGDLSQFSVRDRSLLEVRDFLARSNRPGPLLESPFAMLGTAKMYISPEITPLTTPEYTPENAGVLLEKRLSSDQDLTLIWRDAGQLAGEGEKRDLAAREFLIKKFGISQVYACYTPHVRGAFKVFRNHVSQSTGECCLNLNFQQEMGLTYWSEGFPDEIVRRWGAAFHLFLSCGDTYHLTVYRGIRQLPFFVPRMPLTVFYADHPSLNLQIRLPYFFSLWWIALLNLGCLSLLLCGAWLLISQERQNIKKF
ncbi:MAG: glycosyltransferase family 39 protein [Candidatus Wallbacteria bacterium]|nr:glycosyltransferase family 39 protein [Candidatus Wallbacteria bacterium]